VRLLYVRILVDKQEFKLQASPVKQLAEQHQIPVYQPKSLRKEEAQAELKALNFFTATSRFIWLRINSNNIVMRI